MSKAEFGQLMFAIALTGGAILLTEFDSSTWLVREVAADPERGLERIAIRARTGPIAMPVSELPGAQT